VAGLLPPLGVVAPNGATPLLLVAALAAIIATPWQALLRNLPRVFAAGLAALLLLGLASALWAIEPQKSVYKVGQLVGIFAPGLILFAAARLVPAEQRTAIGLSLAIGIGMALLLLAVERASDGIVLRLLTGAESVSIKRYNRGATIIAILLWPAALALYRRSGRIAAFALIAVSLAVLLTFESRAAIFGLLLGVACAAATLKLPRALPMAFAAAGIAALLLWPVVPRLMLSSPEAAQQLRDVASSSYHRLLIWDFVRTRIAERPLFGWGLDSSRDMPGQHEDAEGEGELLPLHPHNAPLQLRLELGLPAVTLGAFLLAWPILRLHRHIDDIAARAAAMGMVGAMTVVGFVSYGLWQSWWLATLWLAASFAAAVLADSSRMRV
ncbi:MAG: O-antigen ligase family protein, partial [Proteobacteria bacterium]|nr:O-antigen ligase family protein [Pseudomonadota bacterium]